MRPAAPRSSAYGMLVADCADALINADSSSGLLPACRHVATVARLSAEASARLKALQADEEANGAEAANGNASTTAADWVARLDGHARLLRADLPAAIGLLQALMLEHADADSAQGSTASGAKIDSGP